jgi:hypothetical protein
LSESVELLVISIGGEKSDPERPQLVGRDFYHFINADGEKVVPVFTTAEHFREYVRANLAEGDPSGYMDLIESGDEETARALAEEHFEAVAMSVPDLRDHTIRVGADLIMLDPLPGKPCKAWRVPK